MKEFIEKLIGRLEEKHDEVKNKYLKGQGNLAVLDGNMRGLEDATDIVNQLAEEYNNDFCEWRLCDEEANVYDTACRNPHILMEGSPKDNNYDFCPYCGKKIKVVDGRR